MALSSDQRLADLAARVADLQRTLQSTDCRPAKQLASPQRTFRGLTKGQLNKGGSVGVDRYKPGTTASSGITDTVFNELATIGPGKVVYYFRDGAKYFVSAAECPLT